MTTRKELEHLAEMIDRRLSLPEGTHDVEYAYGRPRLVSNGGSKDVSPRLPAGQLEDWMRAYLGGIEAALASVVSFSR
jgi:hypothetical protein